MTEDPTLPMGPDDATLPVGPAAGAGGTAPADDAGAVIGPYHLLRRVGQGGMGDVYEAEQSEPIRRRVALKVIKQGMDTRAVVARFDAERQALALMDHPCIAKVFDAGATAQGRPFFVMEFVEGRPINEYCNGRRLDTAARLELFVRVCEGVQHAHQKAVIHRDLKPSNILVTEIDGRPVPKIIDFGVAKATTQRLTEMTMFTEMGQIIGTPEYMSPEQAAASDDDIDTRTDVYALGVVLYELLAGALPFESKELRKAGYDAIRRIICEQDPPKPSTRFSALGDRATTVAAAHGTAPNRLRGELNGDLDWITMKALEKDRDRRYETANGLAADIRRHLKNEPVTAGPPSASYRLGKLVRRNRGAFAAGGALVLMLAALAVSMTVQAGRLARERDRTAVQAAKAKKTTAFLQSMLSGITPATARGRDTTLLEEILANTARRTQAELGGQPEVEAAIRATLGLTYQALGKFPEATSNLLRADSLQTALLGPLDAATLTTRRQMGVTEMLAGQEADSEARLRDVVADARRSLGSESPVTLAAQLDLSDLLRRVGRHKESMEVCEAVVGELGRMRNPDPDLMLQAKSKLALAYFGLERIDEATAMLREVIAAETTMFGADHPRTIADESRLATVLARTGHGDEAQRLYQEVVASATRVYGPEHPETLKSKGLLAEFYAGAGRLAEAESTQRELLAAVTRTYGPENPQTVGALTNLGNTLTREGQLDEAESVLRQALQICSRTLGDAHQRSIDAMFGLAQLLDGQRRFRESADMLGRIAASSLQLYGDAHPTTVIHYYNWGAKLQDMGDERRAAEAYRTALAVHERGGGGDRPYVAAILNGLGKAVEAEGGTSQADSLMEAGLAMRRRLFGEKHPEIAWSLATMGDVAHRRGEYAREYALLSECVAIRDSMLASDDWIRWATRSDLGRCLLALGRPGEAIPYLESVVTGLEGNPYTTDVLEEARKMLARARRE